MLALIAGRGGLPAAVADATSTRLLVCALEGQPPERLTPDITFRIEHLGTLLSTLKASAVTEVCFCGSIDRPMLDLSKVDTATAPLLPVLAGAVAAGEDKALRAVIGLFEDAGFVVRAAHDLAPHLIPPSGVLTKTRVPEYAHTDIALAEQVLEASGAADLGQSCVIENGIVRAREDARGTDTMLDGLKSEPASAEPSGPLTGLMDMTGDLLDGAVDWLSGDGSPRRGRAGMLYKAPKPGQDLRVDLPTIGPVTAEKAIAAGLEGIVIACGGVIVLEQALVLEKLNAAGLYLWVR